MATSELPVHVWTCVTGRWDVPPHWADILGRAGSVDPRNGAPSMTRLAEESGVHTTTIAAVMYGNCTTRADRIADAIARRTRDAREPVTRAAVHELVGRALGAPAKFEPHPDADLLTPAERGAVNEIIKLLAAGHRSSGVVTSASFAQRAAVSPLTDVDWAARKVGRPPGLLHVRDEIDSVEQGSQVRRDDDDGGPV